MKIAVIALLMATTLLTACKSLDGTYAPACMAYAGDSIGTPGLQDAAQRGNLLRR